MKLHLKTALVLCFAILSGALLVYTSQTVQNAQRDLRLTRAAAQKEMQTIRVLQAEWAFLSAPDRLETLAGERLDLQGEEPRILPSLDIIRQSDEPQPRMHDAAYAPKEEGAP